ncbi:hypothetical protein FPSE_10188 [Fusarium pseudograminearum CS3096]|uniref:RRM domain-containing protein n=1 Tax=Fusarium pseudograminearum (strain CS3096) TaxID=1028729 RepID=K3UDK4_FUSPC|nr:hypothetical protein FPSE_10188 [Fusarium pseudograminearum CS3096]EKJ69651.1 hypothetical protein FPSE_10188 [Fusarium pseudograminearum CS3096]
MTRYSISRDHLSKKSPTVETCLFNRHFPRFTSIPSTSTRDKNILRYGHLPPTPKWHRDRHPVTATGRARALLLRALRVPDPPSAATNTIRARLLALRRPSVETAATGAGAGAAAIVEVEARVVVAAEVIVVERLSKNINESHLQEIFGQFGRIKDLDLPMNRTFGTNRGTAYILYDYEEDAEAAISHMHEAQVDGSAVNVSIVLPRRKLSPPPPTARRGANIDPRVPFSGGRGGPPGAGMGGNNGMSSGRGRRRMSPGSRYGPRSDVYRPGSHSPSRSSAGPTSRSGAGRYRSRSNNSYSSRSRSRSPRRKGAGRHDDRETTRRRGSIDGHGDRSRSRSRGNNPR